MDETLNKFEYRIRELPTRSVTLFPSRAQVTRELKDVPLKPGINEIDVVGLTPTVDEHSIKVQGTGSTAIFTGIAVELLPNRELFQDVYPDSDDENGDSEESDKEEELDGQKKEQRKNLAESIEATGGKLTLLRDDQHRLKEVVASATARLKLLDALAKSLTSKESTVPIKEALDTYREEREKVFNDHMDATVRERKVANDISTLTGEEVSLKRKLNKLDKEVNKTKRMILEAKQKQKVKERLRKVEVEKEKERIRKQREQFWPRSCYTVRITLDASAFTPSSSRRDSIASASDLVNSSLDKQSSSRPGGDTSPTCNIILSYVTSSAFWSPSYDLALSTTTNTARLCFDASLTNMTSETWSNCKITLSNSQTTLSWLGDVIPTLKPWHIKLVGKDSVPANNAGPAYNDILVSREERTQKDRWTASQNAVAFKSRGQYFGVDNNISHFNNNYKNNIFGGFGENQARQETASAFGSRFSHQPQLNTTTGVGLWVERGSHAEPA